jgi:hypothetical protein
VPAGAEVADEHGMRLTERGVLLSNEVFRVLVWRPHERR